MGFTGEVAGAKAGNDNPDPYEQRTLGATEFGSENELDDGVTSMYDDDEETGEHESWSTPIDGGTSDHPSLQGHAQHGAAVRHDPSDAFGPQEPADDDEKLLDDSEVGPGETLPQAHATGVANAMEFGPDDPSVTGKAAEGDAPHISDIDPEQENYGGEMMTREGEDEAGGFIDDDDDDGDDDEDEE